MVAQYNSGSVFGAQQGGPGALFGIPYPAGSVADKVTQTVELFEQWCIQEFGGEDFLVQMSAGVRPRT
jgi:hypothetical protein